MKKVFEWLCGLSLYLGIWMAFIYGHFPTPCEEWQCFIQFLPVISVALFGVYAIITVLWRVYSFNDCPDAAKELKEQIKEARDELRKKGLKI